MALCRFVFLLKNMEKIISENTILKVYLADPDISTADLVYLKEYLDEYVRFVVDEDAKMIYFETCILNSGLIDYIKYSWRHDGNMIDAIRGAHYSVKQHFARYKLLPTSPSSYITTRLTVAKDRCSCYQDNMLFFECVWRSSYCDNREEEPVFTNIRKNLFNNVQEAFGGNFHAIIHGEYAIVYGDYDITMNKMLKLVELSLYGCGYDVKNAQITRSEAGIRIHIWQVGVIYIV